MKLLKNTLGAAIFAGAALLPGLVYASTAANTVITNTVTVNFANAANVAQTAVTDSVSFTVNLVPAAPTLVAGADIDPTTEGTANSITFTITSNANGPDQYNLTDDITDTDINAPTGVSFPANVTLGGTTLATALLGDNTENTLTVPYDGTDDSVVNGIAVGDIIVIDGDEYEVDSIDESTGSTTNTVTITLTTNVDNSSAGVAVGTIIGERQTFDVDLTTGTTIVAPNAFGTHGVEITATSDTDGAYTAADSATIYVRKPVLAVTKYVRNATPGSTFNPGAGGTDIGGTLYYTSGVTGNPTDIMEYVIIVDNTASGAGVANNIVVSDPIPMFTSLTTTSVYLIDASTTAVDSVAFPGAALDVTENGDAAEEDSGTLYIFAGDGGVDTSAGTGGTLDPGERSFIRFRVTID